MESTHVVWHDHAVSRAQREALNGHQGCVVWFTGLSGCGKSTIANEVDRLLLARGVHAFLLDGDNVRHGLNASPAMLASYGEGFASRFGLGFGPEDRQENIRRVGAVAALFAAAGIVTLTAFVSPYRSDRAAARQTVEQSGKAGDFIEVFVDAPLEVCEARDPKGLYKKARTGQLQGFTGIDDPYEAPQQPDLRLDSFRHPADELARQVLSHLVKHGKPSALTGRRRSLHWIIRR
jgi:adenylylsulfate kinase